MQRWLLRIDRLSAWTGKAISWLALLSTALICYDVLMRYLAKPLGDPIRAIWFTYNYSYDMSYYLYAILFMIGGAYTLSRSQHVRGDMFYRFWKVRVQATIDLVLYVTTFLPVMIALVSLGGQWAFESLRIGERSSTSAAAPALWPLKFVIPIAGALLLLQGIAETIRAIEALRTGAWPKRLMDVEETETRLAKMETI